MSGLTVFAADTASEDRAAKTVENHTRDLRHLARWFATTNPVPFSGSGRDLALVQLLRHTGVRVGELGRGWAT